MRTTKQRFITNRNIVHNNFYDYSQTEMPLNTNNGRTKVKIICPLHGPFYRHVRSHLESPTCGCCVKCRQKVYPAQSEQQFIQRRNEVHKGKYTYEYKNWKQKVKVICPIQGHGQFYQLPAVHMRGQGCIKCRDQYRRLTYKMTLQQFLFRRPEANNYKYDYSLVKMPVGKKYRVDIICPVHGKFSKNYIDHLRGEGCQKCNNEIAADKRLLGQQQFIRRGKIFHGDKYDYSNIEYKGQHKKVTVICKQHGPFQVYPRCHFNKSCPQGCPQCHNRISNGQLKIFNYLKNKNIQFIRSKRLKGCVNKRHLLFDFYLPNLNTCIQFDGAQHFKPVRFRPGQNAKKSFQSLKIRDKIKNKYCLDNNIKLIRIPYTQFNNVQNILQQQLVLPQQSAINIPILQDSLR